ncbi:MAG: DEAD/DEAH box helicase family protein [Thermoguttaceae bacterium]|jgi:DNA phosphorothioation system restriction enzyme|nr:DEAD/DEAH box helicase family protein [Thermoguttaceae bacterium]
MRKVLAWLVAAGLIDLQIAVLTGSQSNHLYHEKLGVFGDSEGQAVTFSGSANETLSALEANFESVDIFRSWNADEQRRALEKIRHFESLWRDETEGVEVHPFPRAANLGLLLARPDWQQLPTVSTDRLDRMADVTQVGRIPNVEEFLRIPSDIRLRDHQRSAIRAWFRNKGRGVLAMATGSGKTITALALSAKLYESLGGPILIVIICPFLHLAAQWMEEADRFGLSPVLCAINQQQWYEPLSSILFSLSSGKRQLASIVVSNATFASKAFQTVLQRAPGRTLLIADEVHNLGAETVRLQLPPSMPFRLGLSATPERKYDASGTRAIREYFGEDIFRYPLEQALADGVLCKYFYHPILVQLADSEFDDYLELTRRIGRLLAVGEDAEDSPMLQSLLIKRARLLATAKGKIPKLTETIASLIHTEHNLVYCGDGTVETATDASIVRHIDAVVTALGKGLGMRVARYVADTPLTKRTKLRQQFREGTVQALVAIRCLDEGVDIPEVRRAFLLASSTNPRQFIQRRGRILRRAPGKDFAEIYDFIIEPPVEAMRQTDGLFSVTRRLFSRELERIYEFASLAVNGPEAVGRLLPLRDQLGLLDYQVEGDHGES